MPPRFRIPRFAVGQALLWSAAVYLLLLPLCWPRAQYGGGHYRLVDLALGLPVLAAALVATVYPRYRRAGLRLATFFLAAGAAALAADGYYLFGYVDVLQPHWWHDERGFSLIGTRADPEFGFVKRPNRRWRMLTGAVHHTDARGFRNPPGLRRAEIVFVGDSFTENIAVPEGRTFPALVGRALGVTTANLGVSGYGPQQELRVLQRHAPGYAPQTPPPQATDA